MRILYGALIGIMFSPKFHIGPVYSTPELALIIGNISSSSINPKERLILKLKRKNQIAPDIYEFIFKRDKKFSFKAGQYMEWTLPQEKPDSRGSRRYFTLASSPSEEDIRIATRFPQNPSSLKRTLLNMKVGEKIIASHLAGDFTLSKNPDEKYIFIAGGIGITPFRSMIKYLLDTKQKRLITLFYTASRETDFVYKEIFKKAKEKLNLKVIYKVGHLDIKMIKKEGVDFRENKFYISGPNAMVKGYKNMLLEGGAKRKKIL